MIIVRPHLEYAAPVWSPEFVKDICKLENVQKFALRVCTKQWDVPYLDLIEKCNLPELKTRRNCLGLGLLYKIVNEDCLSKCSPCTLYHNIFHTLTVNQHVRGTSVSCSKTLSSHVQFHFGTLSHLT